MTTTTITSLTTVIDQWPALRALLTTRTTSTWPPADPTSPEPDDESLDEGHAQTLVTTRHESGQLYYACAHCEHVGEAHDHPVRPDREADQLGDRPEPFRLHVLDTIHSIETALCTLADELAADIQRTAYASSRPSRLDPMQMLIERLAAHDARDPARWRYNRANRTAPAAAQWLRARAHDEPGPCTPLTDTHRDTLARIAAGAAHRIERVLGAERRHDRLPRPCPWCAATLTLHHGGDEPEYVTCANGHDCHAAVGQVVEGHRTWATPTELVSLRLALTAAERRRKQAAAKKRQREAARTAHEPPTTDRSKP